MSQNTRRFVSRFAAGAGALAVLWLIAFHALLLARRVADATIAEPGVLLRWLGSALLLAAAIRFRGAVRSWPKRHGAVVFWVLVALVHLFIPADQSLAGSDSAAFILQYAVAAAPALAWALATLNLSDLARRTASPAALSAEQHAPRRILRFQRIPRSPPVR